MDNSLPIRSSSTKSGIPNAYLDIPPQDYLGQGPAGNPPPFDNDALLPLYSVDPLKLAPMSGYQISPLTLAHFSLPPPKRRLVLDAPVRQPDPIPVRQSIYHILNHVEDDSSDSSSDTTATTTDSDMSVSSFDSQAGPQHVLSSSGEPDILRRLLYLEWRATRTHQTLHELQELIEKIYSRLVAEPTPNREQ